MQPLARERLSRTRMRWRGIAARRHCPQTENSVQQAAPRRDAQAWDPTVGALGRSAGQTLGSPRRGTSGGGRGRRGTLSTWSVSATASPLGCPEQGGVRPSSGAAHIPTPVCPWTGVEQSSPLGPDAPLSSEGQWKGVPPSTSVVVPAPRPMGWAGGLPLGKPPRVTPASPSRKGAHLGLMNMDANRGRPEFAITSIGARRPLREKCSSNQWLRGAGGGKRPESPRVENTNV